MNLAIVEKNDLRKLPEVDVRPIINVIITQAHQYSGAILKGESPDAKANELTFQSTNLFNDLKTLREAVSIEELRIVFNNGLRGVYGEFYGLNNKTYIQWVNGFVAARREANKGKVKPLIKTDPTPEEKKVIADECVKNCKEHFLRTGEIIDYGNAAYFILWNRGELRFDIEKWNEYLAESEKLEYARINRERENAQLKLDKITVNATTLLLDQLMSGDYDVKKEARKLALKYFWRQSKLNEL